MALFSQTGFQTLYILQRYEFDLAGVQRRLLLLTANYHN